jgi:hypothetical protein
MKGTFQFGMQNATNIRTKEKTQRHECKIELNSDKE